jgi:hypothetical protein
MTTDVLSQYRRAPPPCPPERGRSCASFTLRARPSKSVPFKACIAREASVFDISTKAKPRGRPVSRSVINETFSTVPWAENNVRTESSVALKGKFPTYSLVTADTHESQRGLIGSNVLPEGFDKLARVADIAAPPERR